MLGTNLLVRSYVLIRNGCPLAVAAEGPDHILIRCGGANNDGFEIVFDHDALTAFVQLGTDKLKEIEASKLHDSHTNPNTGP